MMQTPRFNAWQFLHPDLDAPAAYAGFQIGPAGHIEMVDAEASIRQSILLLLSTAPGERVMRPEYGCSLQGLVFAPNDDTTAGLAIHYVRQALNRWEPRIEIVKLDAGRADGGVQSAGGPVPERLAIELEYRVKATQRQGRVGFEISLVGD